MSELSGAIEREIKDFVRNSPSAHLPFMNNYLMWDEPLVGFAAGDDPIFTEYKTIVAENYLTPREALAQAYSDSKSEPAGISVISWILPITEETRKSNRLETKLPSRLWSHTRWYGEMTNDELKRHIVKYLTGKGYLAAAPTQQPYFKMFTGEKGPYTNWSERHMAYAAGLGTFSLSDGFITEKGIAHRCGSVVTDLALPASPRTATGPYANCLFYAGEKCQQCVSRCPAGAISEKGHDKKKCQGYLRDIGYNPAQLRSGYNNDTSVAGCGFCQTMTPCEFENPVRKLKKSNA